MATQQKLCNLPECPIDPEFWQKLGRILQSLDDGDVRTDRMEKRMERIESKIDDLNHVRVRGAQYGAAGGGAMGVVAAGVLVWLKSKLG